MLSNASAIAAVFASSRVRVAPMTGDEGQAQGPLAGQDYSTQQHLVERMEAKGDNWATWQGKSLELTYAPTFRPRSRRVRRHPVVVAARMAAQLTLNAARAAASRAATMATKTALKHGLIAAPQQVLPNAIKWGPQVAGRAGVNQATSRVFKNRLKYDLKSNQIICQKYDLKSQSNHHFRNDLKSKSNQIVSPIGKLFLSFSYIYQPVLKSKKH
jgi:hypothetical protein